MLYMLVFRELQRESCCGFAGTPRCTQLPGTSSGASSLLGKKRTPWLPSASAVPEADGRLSSHLDITILLVILLAKNMS